MSLTPDIERVLTEHTHSAYILRGSNATDLIGAFECTCTTKLTDASNATHRRHLAEQIAALVEQREETAGREALLGAAARMYELEAEYEIEHNQGCEGEPEGLARTCLECGAVFARRPTFCRAHPLTQRCLIDDGCACPDYHPDDCLGCPDCGEPETARAVAEHLASKGRGLWDEAVADLADSFPAQTEETP